MKLHPSSLSLLLSLSAPSVYVQCLPQRAALDEDLTKRSRSLSPATYEWKIIGTGIDGDKGSKAGYSVSLNADGSRLAVGAPTDGKLVRGDWWSTGSAKVYKRLPAGKGVQLGGEIKGEGAAGQSVSLSGSGKRIAVGVPLRVYDYANGEWNQHGQDINGNTVCLSHDGKRLVVGISDLDGGAAATGGARVFDDIDGAWVQIGQDMYGELYADFADVVVISGNGERVALAAPWHDLDNRGNTRIFELLDSTWTQVGQELNSGDDTLRHGNDVDLNYDGTRIVVGETWTRVSDCWNLGRARVFDEVGGTWVQVGGTIEGEVCGEFFGYSVGITYDGSRVAIASTIGSVRVFDLVDDSWVQIGQDMVGDDGIFSVTISGDGSVVAFGSPNAEGRGDVNIVNDDYDYWCCTSTTYTGGMTTAFELVE